ncbi:MAG: PEP-CTERM sorting domain-containing protein [Candidatus Schekmanbacteria bacterium]|nr:PEP-CTERM sorting domain-containing protein [Candidatus Schekmanbacteria bacterium]
MKKLLTAFCSVLAVFTVTAVQAASVTATVTADNHYALYVGTGNSVHTLVGQGTWWYNAETFTFSINPDDRLYLAVWSDNLAAQGVLGQFVIDDGSTTQTILTKPGNWKKFLTFNDLNAPTPVPSVAEVSAYVANAVWTPVTDSIPHGSSPWGYIAGIDTSAHWIWGSALQPGSGYGEYQILTPIPEPTTMLLLGSGLIGLLGLKKKRN